MVKGEIRPKGLSYTVTLSRKINLLVQSPLETFFKLIASINWSAFLYLPKSSQGHTHGLIIADLYSMYISFFPLKSKSSAAVATALRSYISFQGVPKIVYSDNDPSFKNEVEELLTSFNIQHATAYPYTQRENAVESQVRM